MHQDSPLTTILQDVSADFSTNKCMVPNQNSQWLAIFKMADPRMLTGSDQRLKRNVLEVVIEKNDDETEIILDQHVVARLMDSIKMNTAQEMKGFQIKYNRNGAILQVWCKQGVDLEKFCRHGKFPR